jgi:hypothetical protein
MQNSILAPKTKKRKFFVFKLFSGVYDYFVSWDKYGQPVTLNYNGSDVFQTFPGAVLSILGRMFISLYMFYKIMALLNNTDWNLNSQITNATIEDLRREVYLKDETNFTVAFQFGMEIDKRTSTNDTEYDRLSEIYNKYGSLSIYNYEIKGRTEMKMAKGNVNILNPITAPIKELSWIVEESKKLEKNTFGYYELKFDKSKMIMKGSDQSYDLEFAAYSAFGFGLDQNKLGLEIIERCRKNETCYEELLQEDFLKIQQIKLIYDDSG